ncbi:hypothetical protein H4Q32_003856 [Labeo rohita]|uniref:CBF1-interacting co-repressor CIR N-terminal domain-containing protein n=1 Tax=Labeo rohita TaxID=84645 RepID=A0ABQ8MX21_LABRO|nr:hypothetical protein H4Q32_003856 [Labeo rohita]
MGGGDLNLKKSWHPQTLKNIERVWKAEQKHEAERKKIEELQKELKEERAREEITRYAQETGAVKKKDDRLDWMYQGPAGQISREEYLLGRPIDKQITQQYEETDSGPSAETGLLPGSIFNPTTSLRHNLEKEKKKKQKKKREEKERKKEKKHRKRSSSSDEDDTKHRYQQTDLIIRQCLTTQITVQEPGVDPHCLIKQTGTITTPQECQSRDLKPNPPAHQDTETAIKDNTVTTATEELEKRRREMMDFANEREVERQNNVQRYKQQEEQEKARDNAKQDHHAGFIHDMKLESAATSSLEDRVKRNIHSIQRTPAALEKNFMRR